MRRSLLIAALGWVVAVPLVEAQTIDTIASPSRERISNLFELFFWIAVAIGIGVELLLVWILIRSRRIQHPPQGESERSHAGLEFTWTILPAVLLVGLGYLSVEALVAIDSLPDTSDPSTIVVHVMGQQWLWTFTYPDNTTSLSQSNPNYLYVEEGRNVLLVVESRDVVHSFNVPALGVKIDAIPGHVNRVSFQATKNGTFHMQCTAFCGVGHAYMTGAVVVFPQGAGPEGKAWGEVGARGGVGEVVPPGPEFTVELREKNCPGGGPWCIEPSTIQVNESEGVHIHVRNVGSVPHNLKILDPYNIQTPLLEPGKSAWLNFTATRTGTSTYICAVPGHRDLGMVGTLTVEVRPSP